MERVYGYVRLSRDDDDEKESLLGQKRIIEDYAEKLGFKIIEIFDDDNCTGMNFDRDGILEIEALVKNKAIDVY
nr:recombinase family protein [Clostridium formicaceticum]